MVLDDAAPLEVHEEQLARLEAPEPADLAGWDVEQSRLGAEHDMAVGGLHPTARAKTVAVERRADDAPVGERDRRGPVPGLHQAGVEGVEALQIVGQVLAV